MLALVQKTDNGYTVRFEKRLKHPVEKVWSSLTRNDKLSKWFSQLQIEDLREGGNIRFDMQDGTFKELKIIECVEYSVLEFTWGDDFVRFELHSDPAGCRLVMIEKLNAITAHTPKDLAGWHVCLDILMQLLDGRARSFQEQEWQHWHKQYVETIERVADSIAVQSLYRQLLKSWNNQDARAMTDLFTYDGVSIGFDGSESNGSEEIFSHLHPIFEDHPTARFVFKITEVRFPSPQTAILRAIAGMIPRGSSDINPATNTLHTIIAIKTDSSWLIQLFQNTPAQFHGRPHLVERMTNELEEQLRISLL